MMAWYDRFQKTPDINTSPTQLPDWWTIGRQMGADLTRGRQEQQALDKDKQLKAAVDAAFAENKQANGTDADLYDLIAQNTINIDQAFSQKYSELANSTRYSQSQSRAKGLSLSELGKQLLIERRQLQGTINRSDFPNLAEDQRKALTDRLAEVDSQLKKSDPEYFATIENESAFPSKWNVGGGSTPGTQTAIGVDETPKPSSSVDPFIAEMESRINNAKDTKDSGQMDDSASIIADIDAWSARTGKGVNDREVKRLKDLAENRNQALTAEKKARVDAADKARNDREESATRDKEKFTAFKESTKPLFDAVASGIGLGQAIKPAIEKAIREKKGKLDMNESQKLAALAYQAYNPGTLVAGEMSSAITAAKGGEIDTQLKTNFLSKFGITSNEIPIDKAIEVYNSAMSKSINAHRDYSKQSGELKDNSLLKAYNSGLVNPEQYYFKTAADPGFYKQQEKPKEGQTIKSQYGTGTVGKGGVILLKRK